ncbi:MAG: hypothetical protein RLY64_607 [Bacteroidota bacterium]|jgi:hypothetical protein
MKKILILAFALWGWSAHAQVFQKGQASYYFGGIYNIVVNDAYHELFNKKTPTQALHFKYEKGITSRIGLAVSATYYGYTVYPAQILDSFRIFRLYGPFVEYAQKYSANHYSVIPKIQLHSKKNKWVNTYVGFGVGIRGEHITQFKTDADKRLFSDIWLAAEFNLGMRAKITDQFQAYAEMGFGPSALSAGVVYQIRKPKE